MLLPPINYLEPKDIEDNIDLYKAANKKIKQGFCLIYSSDPSCKEIIPIYQKFANENIKKKKKNIDCYAIQVDSDDWKADSHKRYIIKRIAKIETFPCFILINNKGYLFSGLVERHLKENFKKYSTKTLDGLKEFEIALTGGKKINGKTISEVFTDLNK